MKLLVARRALYMVLLTLAPNLYAASTAVQAAKPIARIEAKAKQQLDLIARDYYRALARFNPLDATLNGDNRFDDRLGLSIGPAQRTRQFALYRKFLARLQTINPAQLARAERTHYDVLAYDLNTALSFEKFPDHLLPLSQMDSVPVVLANFASGQGSQPLETVKQYDAYLRRVSALPTWIDQATANMRIGMQSGIVQPRALIVAALPQFQQLVSATPEANIFYTPIKNLPAGFSSADKRRLTLAYRSTIANKLGPALEKLVKFLEGEYLLATRNTTGWRALPNGHNWYLASVASQTTTSLQPDEIHAIGLKEVARIQAEFAIIGPKMGYTGPASGLPGWVAAQDKFRPFKTEQEVLDVYRKLDAVLRSKLPALFSLVPKAPLDVRLEPELTRATASDHYTSPAADGSRPGIFWTVVNDPKAYENFGMTTLFLHEAHPGHHFHLALLQELNLPDFRKFGGNNAFTEGWALYAETLGKEMGLYEQPQDYFGHLNDEMLRAVRLVVDTGMHDQGWTRERAIAYMRETLGYSEAVAKNAIERYMAWPGQALGYKIGALKISALRQRAAQALGPKFNLPAFHQIVLGEGTLPLSMLEAKVERWIAETK